MRRSVESRRNDSKSWVFFRPAPAPRPPAPPRDGGARRDGGAPTPAYLDDSDSLEDGGAGWHAQQMEAETQRKEALARMGMGSLAENSGGQSAVVRLRPPRPAPPYPASLPPAAEGCAAQIRSPFSGVPNNSRGVGAPRGAPNPPRIPPTIPPTCALCQRTSAPPPAVCTHHHDLTPALPANTPGPADCSSRHARRSCTRSPPRTGTSRRHGAARPPPRLRSQAGTLATQLKTQWTSRSMTSPRRETALQSRSLCNCLLLSAPPALPRASRLSSPRAALIWLRSAVCPGLPRAGPRNPRRPQRWKRSVSNSCHDIVFAFLCLSLHFQSAGGAVFSAGRSLTKLLRSQLNKQRRLMRETLAKPAAAPREISMASMARDIGHSDTDSSDDGARSPQHPESTNHPSFYCVSAVC